MGGERADVTVQARRAVALVTLRATPEIERAGSLDQSTSPAGLGRACAGSEDLHERRLFDRC